jgi:general secretion pathway protein F
MEKNRRISKANLLLSHRQLALLFSQLKQLEAAGLPVDQAFAILIQSEIKLKGPLLAMQQQIIAGRPISEAGFRTGIFNDTLKTLVHAGETSGNLAGVYGQLADYYRALERRTNNMKSRLLLPMLVLMIALFVQPLPALFASKISGIVYLQLSLGRLLVIGVGVLLLIRLPAIVTGLGGGKAWHRLQLRLPMVSSWITKRQINGFLVILAMMLEGGITFAAALPKATSTINNSALREQFGPALTLLGTGASVTDCLKPVAAFDPKLLGIIHSSEQSGKLSGGLWHYTQLEAQTISLQDDALAEWLPRLAYTLIAIGIAYSMAESKLGALLVAMG